jgi:hypothetical protein
MMARSILQVYALPNFSVYLYFDDGKIKKFDAAELVKQGVFQQLANAEVFVKTCTVLNHSLAWDMTGRRDPHDCLDLDAENLYLTCETVRDPLENIA